MNATELADLAHLVASEARRRERLAFDAQYTRFAKCVRCGAPHTRYSADSIDCARCGGALFLAGYTPAPEVP